jgi:uncharacterized protein DUF4239
MIENWLLGLPVAAMAIVVFAATYLGAAAIYFAITRLAVNERAKAFKGMSPGMLPPLGIIFGLLVGFIAAQVWSDFEKAHVAVVTEASALRAIVLLARVFPPEQEARLRSLVDAHIENVIDSEWPAMASQHATLNSLPNKLTEALEAAFALTPANEGQRMAQREMVTAFQQALDARRQRIIISQSSVSSIKWAGLLLQALCTLVAIAMVHSDNRTTCAIALTIFSTGIAMSILLIASYNRPFTGEVSIGPGLLKQVLPSAGPPSAGP